MNYRLNWYDCFVGVVYVSVIVYCSIMWSWQGFLYSTVCCVVGGALGWMSEPLFPKNMAQVSKNTIKAIFRNRQLAVITFVLVGSLLLLFTAYLTGYKTEIKSPPHIFNK
jgi:hypothetical protein